MDKTARVQIERQQRRVRNVNQALYIELVSIGWVAAEAALSGVAAQSGGSLALAAFSVDSTVELISAIVVLSRIWRERQIGEGLEVARLERFAAGVVALCLFALAFFIAFKSGQALALRASPLPSQLGVGIAAASSVITPWLAVRKRVLGRRLHSHALVADAACSFTCAYMAWTLLLGLLLQSWFGWWWADAVAAVGILHFVLQEAWESAVSARTGTAHAH